MAENTEIQKKGPFFGVRHVQILLLFFCLVVNIIDRLKISFAIFAMTDCCDCGESTKIKWNKLQKGFIVSGFYLGMIPTQFVGNFLSEKYGAKVTILISTLGSAITNLCTPFLVPLGGWGMYMGILVVQGTFQSLFTPCIHNHIAKWTTVEERRRSESLCIRGIDVGVFLAMALPGLIAQSIGWQGISYFSGGLSIIWCICWAIFADNSPLDSKSISPEEKDFILTSQKKVDNDRKKLPIPWKNVFTSVPFVCIIIIECSLVLSFKTIQNEMPSYFYSMFNKKIQSNSLFSSLPYLFKLIVNNASFFVEEFLIKNEIMSLTTTRKAGNTISTWIPALTLVLLVFLNEKDFEVLIEILIVITVGITGGKTIGIGMCAAHLSPNHAATLMAITRTACSFVFMLAPLTSAMILSFNFEEFKYKMLFAITALILFLSNIPYFFLGKTEIQAWDNKNFKVESKIPGIQPPNEDAELPSRQPRSLPDHEGELNESFETFESYDYPMDFAKKPQKTDKIVEFKNAESNIGNQNYTSKFIEMELKNIEENIQEQATSSAKQVQIKASYINYGYQYSAEHQQQSQNINKVNK